ncbi:dihydrodipicolinate synthase family protein [Companilactobacillus jidongensis]|uniref:dihydrodipicolinate synthase family protein n=1 Tax=Companilactobacillus jidongensis TaxID=2486006 RepID=UPI000F76B9AD|nr:dihydrodipicolinate synthase family protein [Companilactobacillus jidongensis]
MTKTKNFHTIFPAISVPMNDDDSINEPEFRAYLRWLESFYDDGIKGIVTNGHTGEITALSREERKRVTQIAAEEVGDKMTIVSGVSSENTKGAIETARDAKEAGADGILLMPPHMWLRFSMSSRSPFEFVKDVAEGADIDIILHLYPAYTKATYTQEQLVEMLTNIPHVKGVKMGTRVQSIYEEQVRTIRKSNPDAALLTCHDETISDSLFPEMDGAILGFAGCIPELITKAFKTYNEGTCKELHEVDDKIFPVERAIYRGGQPSGEAHARLKQVLVERGVFTNDHMRKPVLPITEKSKEIISQGVKESGLTKVDMSKF